MSSQQQPERTRRHESRIEVRKIAVLALSIMVTLMSAGACASMRPQADPVHAAFAASAAADVASTQQALAGGAVEVNPLLGSRPSTAKVAAVKVVGFMGLRGVESAWENKLGRSLKWYEKLLVWGVPIGLQTWAAVHNSNVPERR